MTKVVLELMQGLQTDSKALHRRGPAARGAITAAGGHGAAVEWRQRTVLVLGTCGVGHDARLLLIRGLRLTRLLFILVEGGVVGRVVERRHVSPTPRLGSHGTSGRRLRRRTGEGQADLVDAHGTRRRGETSGGCSVVLLKRGRVLFVLATALASVASAFVLPAGLLLACRRAERGSSGRGKSSKRVTSTRRRLLRLGSDKGGGRGPHAAERLDMLALTVGDKGGFKVTNPASEGSLACLERGETVVKLVCAATQLLDIALKLRHLVGTTDWEC